MRRATIRVRLTVLYGGLFLLAGGILLAVTYLLVQHTLSSGVLKYAVSIDIPKSQLYSSAPMLKLTDGKQISADQAATLIKQQQVQLRDATLRSVLTQGSIALGGVGVVAFAFGWLISERALRPVHQITATARRVAAASSGNRGLGERIALRGPADEITELADTFDAMLERLDHSFDGQRRFVANASHELRTPIAINRALLEVAVTRPGASPDLRQLGDVLLGVNERHERLIDGLLTLAESGNEVTDTSPVDLKDIATHVVDQIEGDLPAHRQLEPAPTHGDPVLLERLVQNLVENAVRHNRSDGWLRVTTGSEGGDAVVTVSNTGPAVAPYDTEAIFEPFRRLRGDRTGSERGFGLGLSIVRAVARAHGGDVTAVPRPGGGLVVTARLPASGPTRAAAPSRTSRTFRSTRSSRSTRSTAGR